MTCKNWWRGLVDEKWHVKTSLVLVSIVFFHVCHFWQRTPFRRFGTRWGVAAWRSIQHEKPGQLVKTSFPPLGFRDYVLDLQGAAQLVRETNFLNTIFFHVPLNGLIDIAESFFFFFYFDIANLTPLPPSLVSSLSFPSHSNHQVLVDFHLKSPLD